MTEWMGLIKVEKEEVDGFIDIFLNFCSKFNRGQLKRYTFVS